MLLIYVKHGRVVSVEAMNGTNIVVPDKPHVTGQPDGIVLENDKDYFVEYVDEIEKAIAEEEGQ